MAAPMQNKIGLEVPFELQRTCSPPAKSQTYLSHAGQLQIVDLHGFNLFKDEGVTAMSDVVEIVSSESKGVMAIPHELEETTLPDSHQHLMATEEEMDVAMATEEEPVINVRSKGPGKEIKINMDTVVSEETVSSAYPATKEPTATQKYIERQSEKPPHVRSTKKRQLPPRLKEVGVFPDGDKYLLPEYQVETKDLQKSFKDTKEAPIIPLKKRRPDSPLKKHETRREKLKQMKQKDSIISPAMALCLLQNWRRKGVEINNQWFDIKLIPRTNNGPSDSSFLEQHGFSPGKENDTIAGLENEPGENKKDGQVEVEELENEEDSMPTITEEQTLPVFVGHCPDSPEPENLQDGPVDLTCKNDIPLDLSCKTQQEQEKPIDYSILPNVTEDTAKNDTVVNSAAYSTSATEQVLGKHEASYEVDQLRASENSCDSMQRRSADTKCESLPSLTQKTENLNLHSETLGQSPASQAAPAQVMTVDLNNLRSVLAQLLANQARSASARPAQIPTASQRAAADASCASPRPATLAGSPVQPSAVLMDQRDQDAPDTATAPVPNMLFNLGMTQDDGTLYQTESDTVKEVLRRKLQR